MSGYQCPTCQGERGVTRLLTNLATGKTDCTCDDDLPILLIGELAVWLQVDPQRLYDAVQRFADREAKAFAKAAASNASQDAQTAAEGGPDDQAADDTPDTPDAAELAAQNAPEGAESETVT